MSLIITDALGDCTLDTRKKSFSLVAEIKHFSPLTHTRDTLFKSRVNKQESYSRLFYCPYPFQAIMYISASVFCLILQVLNISLNSHEI